MDKEIIKFEKGKTYTYEQIKNIFENITASAVGVDEKYEEMLRKEGKSEEEIDKFSFSQFLSNMLFVFKIEEALFED